MKKAVISAFSLVLLAACSKNDHDAGDKAEGAKSATAALKGSAAPKPPVPPMVKVDPMLTKEYRLETCYFGTLALRQAREAYLASAGSKEQPTFTEAKPPSFGVERKELPKAPPPVAGKPDLRRPLDLAMRPPYERHARTCTVAQSLKDAPMPEVDPVLATFAPWALDVSRNITQLDAYFSREEAKKDAMAKGKDIHKKLVAEFPKLDETLAKFLGVVEGWRTAHKADESKFEPGQKLLVAAYDAARAVVVHLTGKKYDAAMLKTQMAAFETALAALKTHAGSNASDPWSKQTLPALDAFDKALKEMEPKLSPKGLENSKLLTLLTPFTQVIEARYRALTSATQLKAKADTAAKAPAATAAATAAPAPAADKDADEEH